MGKMGMFQVTRRVSLSLRYLKWNYGIQKWTDRTAIVDVFLIYLTIQSRWTIVRSRDLTLKMVFEDQGLILYQNDPCRKVFVGWWMKICEIIQGDKHHLVRPISWFVSIHPTQMKFNLRQPGWNSYGTNLRTETPGEPVTWAWFSLFMKPVIGVPPNVYEWNFMAQPKVTYKFPKWFSGFTLVKWLQAWISSLHSLGIARGSLLWVPNASRQGVALHAAPQPQPMPTLTPGTRLRVEDREIIVALKTIKSV